MNFSSEQIYHVYNRSFNKTRICFNNENFKFLKKKFLTLKDTCEILAYCIMRDHFHLLLFISENSEATEIKISGSRTQVLSRKIGTILSSYTQAINKQEKRSGSLFQPKTKAKIIDDHSYALNCFHYIHQNPLRSHLADRLEGWDHSSFNEYFFNCEGICNKLLAYQLLEIPEEKNAFYKQSYMAIVASLSKRINNE